MVGRGSVVEMAVNNREVAQGHGARSTSTAANEVERTHFMGVELDTSSEERSRGERSGTVYW
jgi:hypothetical protein